MDKGSFRLAWKSEEKSSTFVNFFKNALFASDYTDVTLVTNNEKQIKAHKLVLGASSPFFQNIFKKNPEPNLVLFLAGAEYEILQNLIDFVYLGIIDIPAENVETFITVANMLKVKGLAEAEVETDDNGNKRHS